MLILPLEESFTEDLSKLQRTKEKGRYNNVKRTCKTICNFMEYSIRRFQTEQEDYHSDYLIHKKFGDGLHHVKNWQGELGLDSRE